MVWGICTRLYPNEEAVADEIKATEFIAFATSEIPSCPPLSNHRHSIISPQSYLTFILPGLPFLPCSVPLSRQTFLPNPTPHHLIPPSSLSTIIPHTHLLAPLRPQLPIRAKRIASHARRDKDPPLLPRSRETPLHARVPRAGGRSGAETGAAGTVGVLADGSAGGGGIAEVVGWVGVAGPTLASLIGEGGLGGEVVLGG